MTKTLGISNFGHCDLPFDLAQGGEPVEPFGIWDLIFGFYNNLSRERLDHMKDYFIGVQETLYRR